MSEYKLTATVHAGAGENFAKTVKDAIENGDSTVMIQVAGEYGHLIIEDIEELEEH